MTNVPVITPPRAKRSTDPTAAPRPGPCRSRPPSGLAGVGKVVVVGAGKGGVGKSTVAANLAVGLERRGFSVGLLDADVYGPSAPRLMGLSGEHPRIDGRLHPFEAHGIKVATVGALVKPGDALVCHGPLACKALQELASQIQWGCLDFLIVDLPPGTGDIAMSVVETLRPVGAVVVSTPQGLAQDDAERAIDLFRRLAVPVLGVVENMAGFVGDDGRDYPIFGRGGGQELASAAAVPLLGSVPITMGLRENSDAGTPVNNWKPKAGSARPEADRALVRALETVLDRTLEQMESPMAGTRGTR